MHPLLTLRYWFSLNPLPFAPWVERALLVGFGVFVVAGIVVVVWKRKGKYEKSVRHAMDRVSALLIWTGIVGLLLWACDYERIPLLSMRAFYVAWLAWVGVWASLIAKYVWKDIPALEARNRERMEREKWLPKRK
jgi:hypothetical protein